MEWDAVRITVDMEKGRGLFKLQMAYPKTHVYDFEDNLSLGPVNYTVLTGGEGGIFNADILNKGL